MVVARGWGREACVWGVWAGAGGGGEALFKGQKDSY